MEDVVAAKARRARNAGVATDLAAVPELNILANHREGFDANILAEPRPRGDRSSGIDRGHFARSTILHIRVASAASWPSTEAVPASLQKLPRQLRTLTSMRN